MEQELWMKVIEGTKQHNKNLIEQGLDPSIENNLVQQVVAINDGICLTQSRSGFLTINFADYNVGDIITYELTGESNENGVGINIKSVISSDELT